MAISLSQELKIIVIEDRAGDSLWLENLIEKTGDKDYTVTSCPSMDAAIPLLGMQSFDVALLSLPDKSGFNGLLTLQHMAPELPVIIAMDHLDLELALSAIEWGAQDYLNKNEVNWLALKRAIDFAIGRKNFEQVLITRANFDMLTGLANRTLFENRLDIALARAERSGEGIGVFFIDVDNFKQVNDRYGHAAGDSLLQQVASRLKGSVRSYDTTARFGGDEFAMLLDGLKREEDCETIAKKTVRVIAEPFLIEGKLLPLTVSIGSTTCMHGKILPRETIMRHADEAMYQAKGSASHYCIANKLLVE